MPVNQLILCPERPELVPSDTAALLQRLHAIGFIADTLTFEGREHYRPGEDFLQLITFLGCSPVVALGEPGATGDEFCHIQFDGPSAKPQFIAGSNVKVPPGRGMPNTSGAARSAATNIHRHCCAGASAPASGATSSRYGVYSRAKRCRARNCSTHCAN